MQKKCNTNAYLIMHMSNMYDSVSKLQEQSAAEDFLSFPTADKLLGLGKDRAEKILNQLGVGHARYSKRYLTALATNYWFGTIYYTIYS